jgi:hypothetical protein
MKNNEWNKMIIHFKVKIPDIKGGLKKGNKRYLLGAFSQSMIFPEEGQSGQ